MFNVNKVPYEISLWEDIKKYEICELDTTAATSKYKYTIVDDLKNISSTGNKFIVNSFYTEEKIATIGSNTMTSPISIHEPVFTEKINGEINLSFYLNYNYYDEEDGVIKKNPFVNLLCNERKVKVGFKRDIFNEDFEWFDFIIKDIVEDSESKKITYNATGLFVNELSKTGFELIFDAELENGQGTAEELIERTLKGSDWQLGSSDILVEKNIEVLYPITLNENKTVYKTINNEGTSTSITIGKGEQIYVFYNVLSQKSSFFQFLYFGNLKEEEIQLLLDEDGVVIDEGNEYSYHIEGFNEWKAVKEENSLNIPDFADGDKLEPSNTIPRGERIIRRQKTILDPNIDKYVTIYTKNDGEDKLYRYIDTVYGTSATVENLLINGYLFNNSSGWEGQKSIDYVTVGLNEKNNEDEEPCLKFNLSKGNFILNTGLNENRSKINDFKNGSKYVIKWRKTEATEKLEVIIGSYTLDDYKEYDIKPFYETFIDDEKGTKVVTLNITGKNFSINDSTTKVGFFVKNTDENNDKIVFFKELQFFEYYENENGEKDEEGNIVPVIPGDETKSKIEYRYIFYNPEINKDVTKIEDLKEAAIYYEENQCPSDYSISYDSNFNKNRAISISESNRFNIIQTICENFECWVDFVIGHESNGKIKTSQTYEEVTLDELDDNDYCFEKNDDTAEPKLKKNISSSNQEPNQIYYRRINKPEKKVNIKQYITKENQAGFKYGINLKSIQRNINSEEITSKVIVKDNSNDYAENGSCSITRAIDSPTKENFLYNFDYYIKQGLISYNELNADLYLNSNNHLNYYNRLRKLNIERDNLIEEQSEKEIAITKLESNITVYNTGAEESINLYNDEIRELKQYLGSSMDISDEEAIAKAIERIELGEGETYSDINAEGRLSAVRVYKKRYDEYEKLKNNYTSILQEENKRLAEIENRLKSILLEKTLLNKKFYEKYSRFIQEGSWISDDYMDDNLYYFDANSVLYTSSRPQISYTINVVDLSHLDGYENYSYRIGDKTFIEDTDFFGWKISAPILTPTQEEVIVSEYIHYFDTPENDIITIQNYKTKFEDLYQRIAATSNSLQFHSGEYGRAASVIETNGTINYDSLQNSLINASYVLENAKNQSVVWDDTGITTTSLSRPGEIVRITSGAIVITNDGGKTWSSAITGYGINANYINTGQIDVNKINIMNGKFPSFKWTSNGLDAYSFAQSEYGDYINTNFNKFIRFDQYGIYGANGVEQNWIPKSSKDIIDNDAIHFSLTWDGLRIKNDDGSVQIDDKDDITVTDKNKVQRIKIGRFNKTLNRNAEVVNSDYGIRLRNSNNDITLEAIDDGNLWLKDMLYIGNQTDDIGVRVGYNKDKYRIENNSEYHEVIYVGDESSFNFIVYEDGYLEATRAKIKGNIYATGGEIGKINITESGLEIKDEGTFVIYNDKEDKVFYADDNGNLQLKNIHALDGYFKGTIVADNLTVTEGSIGGFNIINKKEEEVEESYLQSSNGNIKLDGLNGLIEAEQIHLGTGAKIMDYIELEGQIIDNEEKLPSAFIYNPAKNGGKFIEAGALKIDNKGTIESGTITIDGVNSKIYIGDFSNPENPEKDSIIFDGSNKTLSSNSWTIAPDKATFNNITARGSIQAATFEYGKVQTVGGILFVKASSTVKNISGNVVTVECNENNLFDVNDLCCFSEFLGMEELNSSNIYKVIRFLNNNKTELELASIDNKKINLETIDKDLIGSPFFKLANTSEYILVDKPKQEDILKYYEKKSDTGEYFQTKDEKLVEGKQYYIINTTSYFSDNFSIGINSTSNDSFLSSQSISFNELILEGNSYKNKIRMLLGDLKNIGYKDYGLYADNVYLEGRLVSKDSSNNLTAGINSKGQGDMPDENSNFPWYNNGGKIILWGGSSEPLDAKNANFKVDDKGNLYASSGYFEGAIITNSTIEAAEIRTATITGTGKEKNKTDSYGLIIKEVNNGIVFKGTDKNNKEITYFNLSDSSFETKDLNVNFSFPSNGTELNICKDGLKFNNTAQIENIQILKSSIGLGSDNNSLNFISYSEFNMYEDIIKYKAGEGLKTSQTFSFSNKLFFDTKSENTYMESYTSNNLTKGYDLYITE